MREAGKPGAVGPDTVFQLASCSKPIASSVAAALVGQGHLTWDTRIAAIDPAFQLHDAYPTAEVTVRDLFAHRSGLPGNAGNDLESLGYTRAEILRRVHVLNPAGSFRAVYGYSNFGITEGAVAAAKAAGLGWEKAAQDIIFRPLGMSATSARYADFLAQPDRAVLHVPGGARWIARLTRDPDAQSPGGGISSSARDMARWVRMELNEGSLDGKQIVATAALRETHKPIILTGLNPADQRPSFYGLGWAVSFGPHGPVWEHAGAFTNGARTIVRLLPDQHLGIVVLTNPSFLFAERASP